MPIWTIGPLSERPQLTLNAWGVYEVPLYGDTEPWTRHFVGFAREDCVGHVSSPVKAFDPVTGSGVTRSGRVYQLQDRPGSDADARYVWEKWKVVNGISAERDVSDEVFAEMQCGASGR